jgi:hypothetical protein
VRETDMNYLKTIFITTILLNMSILLSQENLGKENYNIAYTTEAPTEIPKIPTKMPTLTNETIEEIILPEETLKEEKSISQEWNDHLATLKNHWDKENNLPTDDWKKKSFDLAEKMIEKDKNSSETIIQSFTEAIEKAQPTSLSKAINLVQELKDIIAAKLLLLENQAALENKAAQEKKEVIPVAVSTPDPFEGLSQGSITTGETFPTATELTSGTTEGSTSQTFGTTSTSQEQSAEKQIKQWDDLIAKIKKAEGSSEEINNMLSTINTLAPQVLKSGKKTQEGIQQEFRQVLEILGLKKKLSKADVKFAEDMFNRSLSPDEDQQNKQFEQEAIQQHLTIEQEKIQKDLQKFREEIAAQKASDEKKQEEEKKKIQAALRLAEQKGTISEEKAHTFEEKVESLTQRLASEGDLRLKATIQKKEKEARDAFAKTIKQPTISAKKIAEERKAAAEQGIFSKAIKMVTDTASGWWYGATPVPTPQGSTQLEEQQEIKTLETYLASTEKDQNEKDTIIKLWKSFQQNLHITPQLLDKDTIDLWISTINQLLKELVFTHHIVSIEDACTKVESILSLSSMDKDMQKKIIKKIKKHLEEIQWKQQKAIKEKEAQKENELQKKQAEKEQILLTQQKIKDEENRLKAEKEKQSLAAASYKDEKQQWKQFLEHVAQNKQATTKENNALTAQAIKKSHSLFNLASIIPSKNQHSVAQKLKQKFTIALLEQQKANENKVNVHHYMDQFNKEINKIIE